MSSKPPLHTICMILPQTLTIRTRKGLSWLMQNKCTGAKYNKSSLCNGLDSQSWWWWKNKRLLFGSMVPIHVHSLHRERIVCSEKSVTFHIVIFPWNVTVCGPKWTRVQTLLHLLLYYTVRLKVLSTAAFGQPGNCAWNWPCGLSGRYESKWEKQKTASPLLYIHHGLISHPSTRISCLPAASSYQRRSPSHVVYSL